jgi:hypothetical protein
MAFNQTDNTQLAVVEPSAEEDALVQRFVEASREMAPTIQVTLAKRIVRPGSNRVVCLAARTSVPLSDDEAASVSDLALRLSDGTNVVLSLSFFNDTEYSDAITLSRSVFTPERYSARSDSKLGVVLVALAIIALSGFCLSATGTVGRLLHPDKATKAAGLIHKSNRAPKSGAAAANAFKPTQKRRPAQVVRSKRSSAGMPSKSPSQGKPVIAGVRRGKSMYPRRDTWLVPPPPPMVYSLPIGMPLDAYRFDLPRSPGAVGKPVISSAVSTKEAAITKAHSAAPATAGGASQERKGGASTALSSPEPKPLPEGKPVSARQEALSFPIAAEPARASLARGAGTPAAPVAGQSAGSIQPPRTGISGLRAPVPGDDGTDVHLERLVMPAQ